MNFKHFSHRKTFYITFFSKNKKKTTNKQNQKQLIE